MSVQDEFVTIPEFVRKFDEYLCVVHHLNPVYGFHLPLRKSGRKKHGVASKNALAKSAQSVVRDKRFSVYSSSRNTVTGVGNIFDNFVEKNFALEVISHILKYASVPPRVSNKEVE